MATLAELLTSRIPPHAADAERAVLGLCLVDPLGPAQICETLTAADFYLEKHRKFYDAMVHLAGAGSGVDLLTMAEALRGRGQLEEIGGAAYLGQLLEEAAILTLSADYCRLIRDKAALRELIRLSAETIGRAYENGQSASEIAVLAVRDLEAVGRRTGPVPPAAMLDFGAFLTTPPPKPIWLVEGLLLQSANGWLGGPAKGGKSFLVADLLRASVLGVPWVRTFAIPRPLRVAWVEEEDSAWRVYERFTRLLRGDGLAGLPPGAVFKVSVRTGIQVDDERSLRPLLDVLSTEAIDLLVWDVFNKIHTKDEKRPDQMLPILKRLDRLRDEYGCANLVLHHTRKPGVSGPDLASGGQQLRGPSEFWGWAENSLYLKPLKAKGALVVEPESKDALVAPFKVHLEDMEGDARRWVYDGTVAVKVAAGEAIRELILEALALNPMTVGQLVDHTKKSDKTLRRHLAALEQDGAVETLKEPGSAGRRLWVLGPEKEELPF
jgi:DNA-binding transcriptional ArsR family regulator